MIKHVLIGTMLMFSSLLLASDIDEGQADLALSTDSTETLLSDRGELGSSGDQYGQQEDEQEPEINLPTFKTKYFVVRFDNSSDEDFFPERLEEIAALVPVMVKAKNDSSSENVAKGALAALAPSKKNWALMQLDAGMVKYSAIEKGGSSKSKRIIYVSPSVQFKWKYLQDNVIDSLFDDPTPLITKTNQKKFLVIFVKSTTAMKAVFSTQSAEAWAKEQFASEIFLDDQAQQKPIAIHHIQLLTGDL